VLKEPDVVGKLNDLAVRTQASTPQELGTFTQSELDKYGKLIRAGNIRSRLMFTVLVTAADWADDAQRVVREAGGEVVFMAGPVTEEALVSRLSSTAVDAIVLRGSPPITERVLAASTSLRVIAKNGAGVDSVDLAAAARRGIAVKVAAGANAEAVAEHALAMMLSLARALPSLDRQVRRGAWASTAHRGGDFRGSRVGIVGYGAIGRSDREARGGGGWPGARVATRRRGRRVRGRARPGPPVAVCRTSSACIAR
jgi:hypothetical protein